MQGIATSGCSLAAVIIRPTSLRAIAMQKLAGVHLAARHARPADVDDVPGLELREDAPWPRPGSMPLARAIAMDVGQPAADREEHAVAGQLVGGREVGPLAQYRTFAGHAIEVRADVLEFPRRAGHQNQAHGVRRHLRRHEHRRMEKADPLGAQALESPGGRDRQRRRMVDDDGTGFSAPAQSDRGGCPPPHRPARRCGRDRRWRRLPRATARRSPRPPPARALSPRYRSQTVTCAPFFRERRTMPGPQ